MKYEMRYKIDFISDYAENRLTHSSFGTVHSVYRKTINLSGRDGLVALQAKGSPLSPISLISSLSAPEMENLAIQKGDTVAFGKNEFRIVGSSGEYAFSFLDADRFPLKLSETPSSSSCDILTQNIKSALAQMKTGGFEVLFHPASEAELPIMLLAAKERISKCDMLYRQGDYAAASAELIRLIGLGIGLTPSGDDFLCGVLAGLRIAGMEGHAFALSLAEGACGHLADTIDISAAFLSCALEGYFSLAVKKLCRIPSPEEIMADFLEIGHSSGTDTLCGVLFALHLAALDASPLPFCF